MFSAFLVFLSTSSVLFVIEFKVKKSHFPFYQSSLLLAYLLASLTCSLIIKRFGITFLKKLSIISVIISCLLLVLVTLISPTNAFLLTASMLPYGCGFIWVQTPYVTEVMELLPNIKGISASILTSLRLLITAMVVGLTAKFYNATIVPTVVSICLVTFLIFLFARKYEESKFDMKK